MLAYCVAVLVRMAWPRIWARIPLSFPDVPMSVVLTILRIIFVSFTLSHFDEINRRGKIFLKHRTASDNSSIDGRRWHNTTVQYSGRGASKVVQQALAVLAVYFLLIRVFPPHEPVVIVLLRRKLDLLLFFVCHFLLSDSVVYSEANWPEAALHLYELFCDAIARFCPPTVVVGRALSTVVIQL